MEVAEEAVEQAVMVDGHRMDSVESSCHLDGHQVTCAEREAIAVAVVAVALAAAAPFVALVLIELVAVEFVLSSVPYSVAPTPRSDLEGFLRPYQQILMVP